MSCADLLPAPYFAANCGWRRRSCRHAIGFSFRQSHLSASSGRRERSRAQANPPSKSHLVNRSAASGLSARSRSHSQMFSSVCGRSVDGSKVFIYNTISSSYTDTTFRFHYSYNRRPLSAKSDDDCAGSFGNAEDDVCVKADYRHLRDLCCRIINLPQ